MAQQVMHSQTRRVSRSFIYIFSLAALLATIWPALAQNSRHEESRAPAASSRTNADALTAEQKIAQAMGIVCTERARDPLGSMPIDEMQARPSVELNHPEAAIGAQRARRLLPVARELVVQSLRQLATENKIEAKRVRDAAERVQDVTDIIPDPDLRDNAAVVLSDPHTIRFGTIFLVGLPSDEGMMSVLAHELTHIADGRQNSLHPLFRLIGKRAASLTGMRINGQKPEELTCDLIGVRVARTFTARLPNDEPVARRLARALEHNCVDDDDTDEEHLSPRSTMRAVLALDPILARDLIEHEEKVDKQTRLRQEARSPRISLTSAPLPSYHHRLK
jgi:hypothetical protein